MSHIQTTFVRLHLLRWCVGMCVCWVGCDAGSSTGVVRVRAADASSAALDASAVVQDATDVVGSDAAAQDWDASGRAYPDADPFPALVSNQDAGTSTSPDAQVDAAAPLDAGQGALVLGSGGCLEGGDSVDDDPPGASPCEAPVEVDLSGLTSGQVAVLALGAVSSGLGPQPLLECGTNTQRHVAVVVVAPAAMDVIVGVDGVPGSDLVLRAQSSEGQACAELETWICVDQASEGGCETLTLKAESHLSTGQARVFVSSVTAEPEPWTLRFAVVAPTAPSSS